MALEVGSVFARLGARLDDTGFVRYEEKLKRARLEAKQPVEARGGMHYDARGHDQYVAGTKRAAHETGNFEKATHGAEGRLSKYAIGMREAGVALVGGAGAFGLVEGIKLAVERSGELEKTQARTTSAIRSTGGVAHVTAAHVEELAKRLGNMAGVDHEAVQGAENTLLAFTKVRNEVGKGNNVYDQATKAALNLSVATGRDASSSATMLGKALQDPVKGLGLLSRVGVQFDDATKANIKTLVAHGHQLEAQKLVLAQVETRFGGAAAAAGKTMPAALTRLKVAALDAFGKLGEKAAPAINAAAKGITGLVRTFSGGGTGASRFGTIIRTVFGAVGDVIRTVTRFIDTALTRNRTTLDNVGKTLGKLFNDAKRLLTGIAGAFRGTFGNGSSTGRDLQQIITALLKVASVIASVAEAIVRRALPGIIAAFRGFAQVIKGVVELVAGLLTGNFGKAWQGVKDIFGGAIKEVLGLVRAATAPMREAVAAIGGAISHGFSSAWGEALNVAGSFVNKIIDVIDVIPGVNIHHVSWGSSGGGGGGAAGGHAGGGRAYAQGGRYEGGGYLTTPVAVMGEEAPEHPEWIIPTNPRYRDRARSLLAQAAGDLGVPGFSIGGILKDVAGVGSKILHGAENLALAGPRFLINKLPHLSGGPLAGTAHYVLGKAEAFIKDKVSGLFGGGSGGGSMKGAPRGWLATALRATGQYSPANLSALYGRMMQESGGNPRAINLTDSNAAAGHPSKGLLQTIDSTFGSYKLPGHGDIWNPVDNAIAAIRYMMATYGHIVGPSATGYAKGGKHGKRKQHHAIKPILSDPANRGIKRSVKRGDAGISNFERDIQRLERQYDQRDREYGLSDEILTVDHDDGSVTVDEGAVTKRAGELESLTGLRQGIANKYGDYKKAVGKAVGAYQAAVKRLDRAIKAAKGKARAKERGKYLDERAGYTQRLSELRDVASSLKLDAKDQSIDLEELGNELAAVRGTSGKAAPAAAVTPEDFYGPDADAIAGTQRELSLDDVGLGEQPGSSEDDKATLRGYITAAIRRALDAGAGNDVIAALTSTLSGYDAAPAGTGTGTGGGSPSADDVAAAAIAQVTAFNSARADLFGSYGGNFAAAGGLGAFAGEPGAAAGARYFGAGGAYGGKGGAGAPTVTQVIQFAGPQPADPHTFTQAALHELSAAL